MARHPRGLRYGVAIAVLAIAAAGCLPGSDAEEPAAAGGEESAAGEAGSEAAGEESSAAAGGGAEGGTLVVWDVFARPEEGAVIDQLNAEFEEANGVTIERETRPLEDLQVSLPLAMGQPDGPDVASVNQGRADMGTMVGAGLLMDLTAFAEERGWADTFSEELLQRNSFSEDGAQFGTGNVYGVAPQAEVVGFYYNREKLDALGLEVPETFDELTALLEAAEAAGETPINFGNADAWPGIHTYGSVEHTFVDTDYLNKFIFQLGDATFDREENVEAAEVVQGWADAGYFTENFEGIGYDDSIAAFSGGDGVLMLTGSWMATELEDPANFGFFPVPGREAGDLPPQTGGQGVPFAVRADTQNPDLAMEYVDWMVSERAAELWAAAGALPSRQPPEGMVEEGSLQADLIETFTTVQEAGDLGHYLDWATPTMGDTVSAGVQELLSQSTEPQALVEAIQGDYESSVEESGEASG